jgi:Arm DNA-binding domain
MGLTAVAIKAAKCRAKQYKLTDSDGLHLLVLPSGARYWRMNYRHLGKYKTLAFGVWPDVELADARTKRDEARRLLAKGVDPAAQAKLDKITASVAAANIFQAVADEWLAKDNREDLSPEESLAFDLYLPRAWTPPDCRHFAPRIACHVANRRGSGPSRIRQAHPRDVQPGLPLRDCDRPHGPECSG